MIPSAPHRAAPRVKDVTTFHRARARARALPNGKPWPRRYARLRVRERMRAKRTITVPAQRRRSSTIAMQSPRIILFSYLPAKRITRHFCPFVPAKNSTSKGTRKIYYEAARRRLKVPVGPSDVSCAAGKTRAIYAVCSRDADTAGKIARIYNGILRKFRRSVRVSLIARAEGGAIRRYYTAIKITRGE